MSPILYVNDSDKNNKIHETKNKMNTAKYPSNKEYVCFYIFILVCVTC
jgi:hypothetical protein